MREILFRGKPKQDDYLFTQIWEDNCKDGFVYGSLIVDIDKYYICVGALCNRNININNGIVSMIEVIPETVGQYTGVKDKNGTKIFENDICKSSDGISIISFDNEMSAFIIRYFDYPPDILTMNELLDDTEVIGNIHDNSELMKGAKE